MLCFEMSGQKYIADVSSDVFAQLFQYEWMTVSQYLLLKKVLNVNLAIQLSHAEL